MEMVQALSSAAHSAGAAKGVEDNAAPVQAEFASCKSMSRIGRLPNDQPDRLTERHFEITEEAGDL